MNRLIQFCAKNSLLVNLLTLLIVVVGVYSASKMQREAFPQVDFGIVTVTTIYPGASPKEVELYVSTPLEKEVDTVDGIDELTSVSVEGRSVVSAKLETDLSPSEVDQVVTDIQRAVDRTRDLPEDLPDPPIVKEIGSKNFPVIEIAVWGDLPFAEIYKHKEALKDRLEAIGDVYAIREKNPREKEFWVEVDPKKINRYQMGLNFIAGSLKARNLNLPGGAIESKTGEYLVRTIGETTTKEAIENIVLRSTSSGNAVRIKDVARVSETFEEETLTLRTNQRPSVNFEVLKKSSGDIIDLVDQVKEVSEEFLEQVDDESLKVSFVNDMSFFVRNRLSVLSNNGLFGSLFVLISLLIFLSRGIALITVLGMPIAMLAAFIVMSQIGMSINLLSMFGLIIVLGMLVDDAIIVGENIWAHYEDGESAWDAAINGTREVFWPVTATILTTLAAFSPLMMMSGIMGKFIIELPRVVVTALLASLFEAMLVLPSHAYDVLKIRERRDHRRLAKNPDLKRTPDHKILAPLVEAYSKVLRVTLRFRYLFLLLSFAGAAGSLGFAFKFMKFQLFPSEGVEVFIASAELPIGTPLSETAREFAALEEVVLKSVREGELKDFVTQIGKQAQDSNDPFTRRGSHVGQVMVFLSPENQRDRLADDIIESVREEFAKVKDDLPFDSIVFSQIRGGPPVGKPVALRVKGDRFEDLRKAADVITADLEQIEGVKDISSDADEGKEEVQVVIDGRAAARSLLSVQSVAQHIRTALSGTVSSYVRTSDDRIPIRVRYPKEDLKSLEILSSIRVANSAGNLVPLVSVAHWERRPGLLSIKHRDKQRTMTVSAAIDESVTSSRQANQVLLKNFPDYEQQFPNLTFAAGGEYEDTDESMKSLFEAFAVALGLIFLILATLFQSLSQPFVVMSAIPFASIGVIWSFYVHGMPLSFLGLIGAIGLTGVIVNDSIVLVAFVNRAIEQGQTAFEAAVYAGKRRFRAVWLTTLTTVAGLVPLVYGIGGYDLFLRPAAVALGYGLFFGTILILLFIPAVYLVREDIVGFFRRRRSKNQEA